MTLLALLTIRANPPITLVDPRSIEHAGLVVAFVLTGIPWRGGWRPTWLAMLQLAVSAFVVLLHPLTASFGRDGTLWVAGLYCALVAWSMRSLRVEWRLLWVTVLVGLGLSELTLSALREPRRPPALLDYGDLIGGSVPGGFLRPGLDVQVVGEHGPVRFTTNRQGFRNVRDTALRKPAGTLRVVAVGDSFVAGYRVDQSATVGSTLEGLLAARLGKPVEILVATAGYPGAAREWFRKHGAGYEPDLVLLGVTLGNDLAQGWLAQQGLEEATLTRYLLPADAYRSWLGLLPVRLDRSLRSWRVYQRLSRLEGDDVIFSWYSDVPTSVHVLDPSHALGLFYTRQRLPEVEAAHAVLQADLAALHRECRGSGARLVVFLIPQRFQASDREWARTTFAYGLEPSAFDRWAPNRRIVAGCQAAAVACLDLTPGFHASGRGDLYLPRGDMHWSAQGNAIAARLLADELLRQAPW